MEKLRVMKVEKRLLQENDHWIMTFLLLTVMNFLKGVYPLMMMKSPHLMEMNFVETDH